MRWMALRVAILACILATAGAWWNAPPLSWFAFALAVVAIAALLADMAGGAQ